MFHTTAYMKNIVPSVEHHEPEFRDRMERRLVTLSDSIIAGNPDRLKDEKSVIHPGDVLTIPQ